MATTFDSCIFSDSIVFHFFSIFFIQIKMLANLSLTISATPDNSHLQQMAEKLARELNIPLQGPDQAFDIRLFHTTEGLKLQREKKEAKISSAELFIDFNAKSLHYRRLHGGGIKQPLARAVGIKSGHRPTIIDATAGLGLDSFILSTLGCKVTMVERSPILALLLKDGLKRAAQSEELKESIQNRLTLICDDSINYLKKHEGSVETIYLDPMYPHRKKSALNKQEMRFIRLLVGDDIDANTLLETSIHSARRRVVVKRPKSAPHLGDKKPSHIIRMKNSRFDVYMSEDRNQKPDDR